MIKIKVKDKPDKVILKIKGANHTLLECIALLDKSINLVKEEYSLSDEQIARFLDKYRKHLKEMN